MQWKKMKTPEGAPQESVQFTSPKAPETGQLMADIDAALNEDEIQEEVQEEYVSRFTLQELGIDNGEVIGICGCI